MVDYIEQRKAERKSFFDGIVEGYRRYAYWKDGVEYVGTCGTTLKDAISELKKEFGYE